MSTTTDPMILDALGTDVQAEGARLRERGSVTEVLLPGDVRAWDDQHRFRSPPRPR